MNPSLSVVIVSYRSREPLVACLESLADCRATLSLEVIVVDNASGDGTADWLRSAHPWVETIASPVNSGFTRGVNLGVARSSAANVFVLNPDCVVTPEALARLIDVLDADPSLAAVAPALDDGRGDLARSCGRFPTLWTLFCDHLGLAQRFPASPTWGGYKYGGRTMESLDRVDWASGAALMVPRARWAEIGGLDERIFMYMEEVDWCRRAAKAGHAVRFVPDARIIHVGQQSSRLLPGETYLHNLRSRVYYFRKHHGVLAAWMAKAILCASLVCKWAATAARAAGDPAARVYAAGIEAVWVA